jgi:hypothetical protein
MIQAGIQNPNASAVFEGVRVLREAFLRGIQYRIRVPDPSPRQFSEVFRRGCLARGIEYSEDGVRHVYAEYYGRRGIAPRSCHPRDILERLMDTASFLEVEPRLTRELLDRACGAYFLSDTTA